MSNYFTWLRTNVVALLIAFFAARFVARLLMQGLAFAEIQFSSLSTAFALAMALQGLLLGVVYCQIKRIPVSVSFALATAAVNLLASLPLYFLVISADLDARWFWLILPLGFIGFSVVAMRMLGAPITTDRGTAEVSG